MRVTSSRSRLLSWSAGLALSLAVVAGACGDDTNDDAGQGAQGTHGSSTATGAEPTISLRVDPPQASLEFVIGKPAPTFAFTAFAAEGSDAEQDVTASTGFSLANPAVGTLSGATLTLAGVGGGQQLHATYQGASATAAVHVKLSGDVVVGGADPTLPDQFDAATVDPTPGNEPVIEYPGDGVVLPGKPSTHRVAMVPSLGQRGLSGSARVGEALDVSFYGTTRELLFPADVWSLVRQSVPDQPVTLTVDGLGAGEWCASGLPRRSPCRQTRSTIRRSTCGNRRRDVSRARRDPRHRHPASHQCSVTRAGAALRGMPPHLARRKALRLFVRWSEFPDRRSQVRRDYSIVRRGHHPHPACAAPMRASIRSRRRRCRRCS